MKTGEANILIRNLSETRSVEVKSWIDPTIPEGKAKLIKGMQALRNYNGGQIVIGFDDATLQPTTLDLPTNVRTTFHSDNIQQLAAKYSSESFDVEVLYPKLNGQEYVVIAVPSGVRTPVAAKSDVPNPAGGNHLVQCNDVYFRTLSSNNTVSTSKIPYKDWPELLQICFDNREADIGRFLRRHLSDLTPDILEDFYHGLTLTNQHKPSEDERVKFLLDDGRKRFLARKAGESLELPEHGSFEVGLVISAGSVPEHSADREFLQILNANNPGLTGWPVWLDSDGFHDKSSRPYVLDNGWEALIVNIGDGWPIGHIDFMRKEPTGQFYLRRALQDDLSTSSRAPEPNSELDFVLAILRTAEVLAVGKSFATALGYEPDKTMLEFGFRWSGLKGRTLSTWANPSRYLSVDRKAVQDEVICRTSVPLFASPESISEQTYVVVSCLFAVFDGFVVGRSIVEDLVQKLLERRL